MNETTVNDFYANYFLHQLFHLSSKLSYNTCLTSVICGAMRFLGGNAMQYLYICCNRGL